MRMNSGKVMFAAACLLLPVMAFAANAPDKMRDYLTTAPGAVNDDAFQKALQSIDNDTLSAFVVKYGLDGELTDATRAAFAEAVLSEQASPTGSPEGPGPVNDECAGAIAVFDGTTSIDNTTATESGPVTTTCGFPFGDGDIYNDIWFTYVATCSGDLSVDTCGGPNSPDTRLVVYSGACGTLGVPLECNDDSGNTTEADTGPACPTTCCEASLSTTVSMGSTYLIRLGNFSGTTTPLVDDLNISCVATSVCPDGVCDGGETSCTCPADCGAPGLAETVCDDGLDDDCDTLIDCADTVDCDPLSLPAESACGDGLDNDCDTLVDCADPDCTVGTETVCTDGLDDDCDTFVDCDDPDCVADPACIAPANDLCVDFVALGTPTSGGSVSATSDNLSATNDATVTCGTTDGGTGVWYTVIGTGNTLTATTCNPGTDFDTKLTVFCSGCAVLNCVDGNDDTAGAPAACDLNGSNRKSTVTWCSDLGVEYHIMVHGFSGATGNFELTVTDDAAGCATPPTCSVCGDGSCDGAEDSCSCAADCGAPPATETNCGDGLDDDCDTLIDCNDPDCTVGTEIDCADGLDNDCDGNTDCADTDCQIGVETDCTDGIDNDCNGLTDCADIAQCPMVATETDCGNGADDDCDTLVDCADVLDCDPGTLAPEADCADGFDDDCDTFIDCADPDCAANAACLPPPNDDCASATPISDGAFPFDTTNATTDGPDHPGTPPLGCEEFAGNSNVNLDAWFEYTATCNGFLTADTCGSALDTKMAVYNANVACTPLASDLAECSDDNDSACGLNTLQSGVAIPAIMGNTYLIRVGGFSTTTGGTGTLTVGCVVPVCGNGILEAGETCDDGNTTPGDGCDEFCQFEPITGDECIGAIVVTDGSTPYDNTGATFSAEAVCDTDMTDSDIWYVYTATCVGTATIAAGCNDAAEPDMVLEVDSGACASLTNVGCADDTCGLGSGFASTVDVAVVQGDDYYIRLSGWNGGTVTGTLEITCVGGNCGANGCEAPFENECNCPADCGAPPANEDPATCFDGVDNDCDGNADCADTDCQGGVENTVAGSCADGIDNDCDGALDCYDNDCLGIDGCPSTPIPTMSEWGLIVMVMLLLAAGTVVFARRRRAMA